MKVGWLLGRDPSKVDAHPLLICVSNAAVTRLAICFDLVACCVIVLSRVPKHRYLFIAWVGFLFLAFHSAASVMGRDRPCGCFGQSTFLEQMVRVEENVLAIAAASLIFGGGIFCSSVALLYERYPTMRKAKHTVHRKR